MPSFSNIVALGAFFSAVAAVPMKRELVVNTVTEIDIVTDVVTATVWVDAPTEPTQHAAAFGHEGPGPNPWTHPAAFSTTSSVYIAPASTSTSSSTTSSSTSQVVIPAAYTPPPPPVVPVPSPSSSSVYVAPPPPTTTSTSEYVAPSPTSQYIAPAPTTTSTSEYVAPIPAYTPPVAPTTTTPAPAATTTSGSNSSGSGAYTGDITFYDVGLGSCGYTNTDSEMVVAMAASMMDKATMCGKTITMSYGGVTHEAKVVDTCPGCKAGSLDLSPALFKVFADTSIGRGYDMTWHFNN